MLQKVLTHRVNDRFTELDLIRSKLQVTLKLLDLLLQFIDVLFQFELLVFECVLFKVGNVYLRLEILLLLIKFGLLLLEKLLSSLALLSDKLILDEHLVLADLQLHGLLLKPLLVECGLSHELIDILHFLVKFFLFSDELELKILDFGKQFLVLFLKLNESIIRFFDSSRGRCSGRIASFRRRARGGLLINRQLW